MIRKAWNYLRFGAIRELVCAEACGTPTEIAYYGRGGRLVGYWAYGYFDPNYPYRG